MSVETTRTAPPAYETSSLFNAHAPVPPQYRDTGLALPVESPRHSVASSSFHPLQSLDGLVAQSSQIQRSRSVRASHLDNRTNFIKPGENIGRHEPPAPPSAPMTQRAQSSTTVRTPPPSASVPSTPTSSRPRSRTPSLRAPTHTEGSSSTSRTRTRTMSQPSQDHRRARELGTRERTDHVPTMPHTGETRESDHVPRMPHTGESDVWLGNEPSITALSAYSNAGTRSLISTMRQVLSNRHRYVTPLRHLNDVPLIHCRFRILVLGKVHSCHTQPNSGQIETILNHREARENPHSSTQSSK